MKSVLNIKNFILSVSILTAFTALSIWATYGILYGTGFNQNLPTWLNYLLAFLVTVFPISLFTELTSFNQIYIDTECITLKRPLGRTVNIKRANIQNKVIKTARTSRSPESHIYSTIDNKIFFINRRLFKNFGALRNELNKDKEIVERFFAPIPIYFIIIWTSIVLTLGTIIDRLGSS